MYSIVGSHLWIRLILDHLREGPGPVFAVTTLVHILSQKRLQETAGRHIQ